MNESDFSPVKPVKVKGYPPFLYAYGFLCSLIENCQKEKKVAIYVWEADDHVLQIPAYILMLVVAFVILLFLGNCYFDMSCMFVYIAPTVERERESCLSFLLSFALIGLNL